MRYSLFVFYFLFFVSFSLKSQEFKILSVHKKNFITDLKPKKYLKTNSISSDSLIFDLNKKLAEHFKKNAFQIEYLGLSKEQFETLNKSKLNQKKVLVNPGERKPPSQFTFLRFFRKEKLKTKIYYLNPYKIIDNNPSYIGSKGLIVFSKYRINNRWALNFDFRNKTRFTLYYSIYDNQGILIKHYRCKMDVNFQKDMNKEVLFHIQYRLSEECINQIKSEIK
jgi:hypothetical protein